MNPRRITLGYKPALPPRIQRVLDRVICILRVKQEVAPAADTCMLLVLGHIVHYHA
jgi:hypothetical protein